MMGRAFIFADNIDTDVLAPGSLMKLPPAELARHCLAAIDPTFALSVKAGDILVAGSNFGLGSSREQAAVSLKTLGISAVLAKSFARIFYRNAINVGLPVIAFPNADEIKAGDELRIDLLAGIVENLSTARRFEVLPLPPHLMAMIDDGGLIPHLKRKFAQLPGTAR
jgi:3-isopropylmalate/(R)-2-methylmalate dehydratase small subunit